MAAGGVCTAHYVAFLFGMPRLLAGNELAVRQGRKHSGGFFSRKEAVGQPVI